MEQWERYGKDAEECRKAVKYLNELGYTFQLGEGTSLWVEKDGIKTLIKDLNHLKNFVEEIKDGEGILSPEEMIEALQTLTIKELKTLYYTYKHAREHFTKLIEEVLQSK